MDSIEELWGQVCKYIKKSVSETSYNTWIAPINKITFVDGVVNIYSINEFRNTILKTKFNETIAKAFEDIFGFNIDINYVVEENSEQIMAEAMKPKPKEEPDEEKKTNISLTETTDLTAIYNGENQENINEKNEDDDISDNVYSNSKFDEYTFDNFIVGASNKLAYAAAMRVATSNPGSVFNPLFIWGRSGLGKTHLMLAIRNEYKIKNPDGKFVYTTSENFMNEYIACITNKDMAAFRNKYRNVDALFIDDIQFIKKKIQTQEEFFHTFNELVNNGKQIVMTSDRPPKEIENLDERIKTRFEAGLITDVQSPDVETRTAIVMKKAKDLHIELSRPVVDYIAEKIKDNIRQIEGTVKKISAMLILYGITPTITTIQDIIKDVETSSRPISAVIDEIIAEIADKYDVTKDDITSDKRDASIRDARNEAIYVIREVTNISLENIGSYFGNRKHTTVKHSIEQMEKRIKSDFSYKNAVYNVINHYRNNV